MMGSSQCHDKKGPNATSEIRLENKSKRLKLCRLLLAGAGCCWLLLAAASCSLLLPAAACCCLLLPAPAPAAACCCLLLPAAGWCWLLLTAAGLGYSQRILDYI